METERGRHETEESLILAQFGASQNISHKLQNGNQTSDEDPMQLIEDNNWNHYKPSIGINSMKRHRESCDSPSAVQGLFDQGSYALNGELKHALNDQSSLIQQKKLRVESEAKESDSMNSSLVDNFPQLSNTTEFECNASQTESSLDKRNCNFQNGDIFSLSRNKQGANGAISPPSTIESTPGDLIEKTLSQYYPEQVSIAPQTSGSQPDAINGLLTNKLSIQGAQPPLTSGLPTSAQMPASEQQQPGAAGNTEGSDRFNSVNYIVNGFSKEYQAEQQLPSYSDKEHEHSLGQLPGMITPTSIANRLQQHQNGQERYPECPSDDLYVKPNQEFNQNRFLEHNGPLQAAEVGRFGPCPNSGTQSMGQCGEPRSHQTDGETPHQSLQQQVKNGTEADSIGAIRAQQPYLSGSENGMDSQQRLKSSYQTPHQRGWTDLNSPHSQQPSSSGPSSQAKEQDVWQGIPPNHQSEQQGTNPQAHGKMIEQNPAQIFQTHGRFVDGRQGSNNIQQQQLECFSAQVHGTTGQHNTAPEWQHANSRTPQQQKMPEQCNLSEQQQAKSHYHNHMQSEHLCEGDPELQQILSPGYLSAQQQQHSQQQQQQQQQRPLSHPPLFEQQQLKSPDYRPHSQPHPGQNQLQISCTMKNNSAQPNNQSAQENDHVFSYNSAEMQKVNQLRPYPSNSSTSNLKQFSPQQHINQPQLSHKKDFPETSTNSPSHAPQGVVNQQLMMQMCPKGEQLQFQRGPRLPLGPTGAQGDFQRHAALRMHLLQKQERQGHPQPHDPNFSPRFMKVEGGPRFDTPTLQPQVPLKGEEICTAGIKIKQEPVQSLCEQSRKQSSILASMEHSLKQYQLSPVFERKSLVLNSSNKVKVESSGAVTILSTNTELGGMESPAVTPSTIPVRRPPEFTPKKEPLLQSFMESPMKLLDTPIKNLLDTPMKTQYDIASCHCVEQISEKDEGPYYTHLGAAPTVAGIREAMEKRTGLTGCAIRIEKVIYTGKEGKSTQGCPIAKWVIRRSSVEEKVLVLVRERTGHTCDTACIIVVILIWEGISSCLADRLYLELSETLTKHGALTQRRCALNEERTCACQGLDPEACGASFSFGCSWSMYYNGCKFARSKIPRKFKLLGDDMKEEERLESNLQSLATLLAPLYKSLAPEAYGNQVEHEHRASDCRLGHKEGRPFSGVTACMDFCAHAHRDLHNMQGGSTVVCTLTREDNREIGKIPEDEQLHVLPLYKACNTDEFGSEDGQLEKIKSGAIQVLSAFRRQVRMLAEPAKSCRQKKLESKKAAANKNAMQDNANDKAEKALQAKTKAGTYENAAQSTAVTGPIIGAVGAPLQTGQSPHPLGGVHPQQLQRQQHQSILPPYPGTTNSASYPRFLNHPGTFTSTSKTGNIYPPSTPASPYPPQLHVPNSFMNGSNRPYPGYQCNGGIPLENYHPYYTSNPKQMDVYRQQRPALYPEQQYGVHQRYEVNYPPRYGEPGLPVNGYNGCNMRPVHPMRPYHAYGPNRAPDPHFMEGISRTASGHVNLDYAAAVSKGNQFGGYPNPYLNQGPQILPTGQDPFHMQIKTEMGLPGPEVLSTSQGAERPNSETSSGFGLPSNGSLMSNIKQEPGTPQTPTTPQKPEMWSDNEHNFLDPDIGGVAVAPSHGSVLIECAKRELHATTPLKNPDRTHPTRISLVFYQHKNMNEAKHGLALWEAKMAEKAREKEEDAERNGGEGTPSKSTKKGVKREHSESSEPIGEPPYKRFIQALMQGSSSCTTNTYVSTSPYAFTKVTGPYSQFG